MKIAVAGTGYVGLSLAVLLSQHNEVHALDIVPEKVQKINNFVSPIQDDEIERFLAEAKTGERELDLHATVDVAEAYTGADYAVIATPTNYDSDKNFFDTSSVEAAIAAVRSVNPDAWIVIKSTIPVGYTAGLRERLGDSKIFFSPEFLRESKALYDNLHPSRIVVGAPKEDAEAVAAAERFAGLLAQGADPAELERVNADGTVGLAYTTDWNGKPVVTDRMHWTLAESLNTSATLYAATGEEMYANWYATFAQYVDEHVIDHESGSWFHQLDKNNHVIGTVWPGKSDLYHAFQSTLIPFLDPAVSIATAVKNAA